MRRDSDKLKRHARCKSVLLLFFFFRFLDCRLVFERFFFHIKFTHPERVLRVKSSQKLWCRHNASIVRDAAEV